MIKVNKSHASYETLKSLYNTERNGKIKIRLLAIMYFYEGKTSVPVSKLVKQSDYTVRQNLHRWNARGYEGLRDIPHPEPEYKVSDSEVAEIDAVLKGKPNAAGFEQSNWTAELLRQWIERRFGVKMVMMTANRIMHRLNYSKTRAKKQNRNVDIELAEAFRETVGKMIENKDENTVILYEDETIIGSEPGATSVWTKVGNQAIVPTTGGNRKRKVIFGAVNPENGDLITQLSDSGNTENFKDFLK